jgi:hypothetical protein
MLPTSPTRFARLARASALLAAIAAAAAAAPASAADAAGVRVRGTVIALAGDTLQVQTREGAAVSIALAPGWSASAVVKLSPADIKPGDYVGVASEPTVTGGDGALEVLVFPPAMKGTGEGSAGWDLKPQSTMTNGSVADAVTAVDGSSVTVTYHGQSRKISIAADTPVVTLAPATRDDVRPGAAVFVPAQRSADGTLSAGRLVVGKNGVAPPM